MSGRTERKWILEARLIVLAICLPLLCGASGCPNMYAELADTGTDEALLFQAKQLLNGGSYSEAIDLIESMTAEGQGARETKIVLASAYAGRCGLDLLDLAGDVADGTDGGFKLFQILLSSFAGANATNVADCKTAESVLLSISDDPSARSDDENVISAFVAFSKIGAIFAASGADEDDDGTVDGAGGFDSCTNTAAHILDSDVQEIGSGLTIAMSSLAAADSDIADEATTSFDAVCSAVDTLLGTSGFCSQTSPDDFNGSELSALRSLIKSNEIGFDMCGGSVTDPACQCP